MNKERLFSVGPEQFDLQFFRAGGKGGQKQNKTSSACRVIHKDSGAVGECREERSQTQNKRRAFERCVASEAFQNWLRLETAARLKGYADAERMVDEQMAPENIKVEYFDPK